MKKKIGTAMVVGAGISGIRSALDLAEFGYRVTLVDKAPGIGGILSQLDYQFPTDGCGMCKMLPLVNRDESSQTCLRRGLFHENINILSGVQLKGIQGEPGNFKVTLEKPASAIDPALCLGCGECAAVCPVEVPDSFNLGMGLRKAVYLPVPHMIPNAYTIDFKHCNRCNACVTACPAGAIRLPEEKRKQFHILIVDDELIVRDSLKEWLLDEGFSVDMADSGRAALDLLSQKPFHLMLTDIKMPGMDGVELLTRAKELFPTLPIVMMTAYATVETAVEALKTGAGDYLLKPFDPRTFIPKILEIYQAMDMVEEQKLEVNALVLATGADYFDPSKSKNTFGYGIYPDMVTSREFERLISGSGPTHGELLRRSDAKPVQRIAWFQCVGSRDFQTNSDFCSSVCCMHAVKEARLVKEKLGPQVETVIFYMDMRAFGKSYHAYQTEADQRYGIRFERSRVHTVIENKETGGLDVFYADHEGIRHGEQFDMIVLSIGQRPGSDMESLARMAGLTLNEWGFAASLPFSTSLSGKEGVFLGGSISGLKDISDSVIQAGSASLCASRFIHSKGGGLSPEPDAPTRFRDVTRELPKALVMVCTCGQAVLEKSEEAGLKKDLMKDPVVGEVIFLDRICTEKGWAGLTALVSGASENRLLIGACLPCTQPLKIRALAQLSNLHPGLVGGVDIRSFQERTFDVSALKDTLKMGIALLRRVDPPSDHFVPSIRKLLVVGGGIAGMTAALAVADHGFEVDLVEQQPCLGGNLIWLQRTIEGHDVRVFCQDTLARIEKHPLVHVHPRSEVTGSFGSAGCFLTTLRDTETDLSQTLEHGAVILATGGKEAETSAYGHGENPNTVTQKELEQRLSDGTLTPDRLESVVMIQCVESREASQKNYCSRICCISALKNALHLKELNPDLAIYIFYRDIMAYGFFEHYYTLARKKDIIFIQYDPDHPPRITPSGESICVVGMEPVLGLPLEITADLVVLSTGVVPMLPKSLAGCFGAETDASGFFREAEYKWRPVDSLKEGVFACGLCHSPRSITEAVASAEACAQRALRIIGNARIKAASVTAQVHHSLCSLCERCIEACPYGARSLDTDLMQIVVDAVMCQGCGSCAAVCPNSASVLAGFKDQQVFDAIDAIL